MKKTISLVLVLAFIVGLTPRVADATLVACVGSSTTYGYGLPDRVSNCYPAQLARILQGQDSEWETRNFGVNGTCVLRNGSKPYITQSTFHDVLACEPDVVVIQLGVNDSVPNNWVYKDDFIPDFLVLIDAFAQLPSQPQIYIWYPKPVFSSPWGHDNSVIRDEIIPLISQLPTHRDVQVIDLYTPLEESRHLFQADGVHLNVEGTRLVAEIVAATILGLRAHPDFNGDGKVDFKDFCELAQYWSQGKLEFDIVPPPDGDDIVDLRDFAAFVQYWLKESGFLAHWKLDETEGTVAYDDVGRNHSSLNGNPIWQPASGKVDGALEFDGTNDYVSTDFVLNPVSGSFSAFAWIKGGAPGQTIISQTDGTGFGSAWLCTEASEGRLMTRLMDAFFPPLECESVITDDQWHHVGLVYDIDVFHRHLYVDGHEVAKDTSLVGGATSDGGLYIGAGKDLDAASFFSGLIDDVRIYNVALSAEEIEELAR